MFPRHRGRVSSLPVGPGCGKTTIQMIAGFDEPDEGQLYLDGKALAGIPPEQRPVHTVFQTTRSFPTSRSAAHVLPWRCRQNLATIKRRENEALALRAPGGPRQAHLTSFPLAAVRHRPGLE